MKDPKFALVKNGLFVQVGGCSIMQDRYLESLCCPEESENIKN